MNKFWFAIYHGGEISPSCKIGFISFEVKRSCQKDFLEMSTIEHTIYIVGEDHKLVYSDLVNYKFSKENRANCIDVYIQDILQIFSKKYPKQGFFQLIRCSPIDESILE